jgi:hypothetical protein
VEKWDITKETAGPGKVEKSTPGSQSSGKELKQGYVKLFL